MSWPSSCKPTFMSRLNSLKHFSNSSVVHPAANSSAISAALSTTDIARNRPVTAHNAITKPHKQRGQQDWGVGDELMKIGGETEMKKLASRWPGEVMGRISWLLRSRCEAAGESAPVGCQTRGTLQPIRKGEATRAGKCAGV